MTLREWLDEFGQIASPYKLEETAKMRALFDHLTGTAKDEVMCLLDSKRYEESFLLYFIQTKTVQSISSTFHNSVQETGESLAD